MLMKTRIAVVVIFLVSSIQTAIPVRDQQSADTIRNHVAEQRSLHCQKSGIPNLVQAGEFSRDMFGVAVEAAMFALPAKFLPKGNNIVSRFLPKKIAETFENAIYRRIVLKSDVDVVRVFGGVAEKRGGFLTKQRFFTNRAEAIINLRLPPENLATGIAKIRIAKGTEVFVGKVAGGNAYQYFVRGENLGYLKILEELPLK